MKKPIDSFWYLASPYSKYPSGHEAAYRAALEATTLLLKARVHVFSPIVHGHNLDIDRLDHDFWMWIDTPFMAAAQGLIVLCARGWDCSQGVAIELATFRRAQKPITFMCEGYVPSQFRK